MPGIEIRQEIIIELDGNSPFEYVVAKEGDKDARIIAIQLLQNKQPYVIPQGCTARIKYYKPDGYQVLNDCTIEDNKILVTYTAQMLAASGTAKGEVLILQGTQELKSATYYTKIVPEVYKTEGDVESDKEFMSLAEELIKVDQACDMAEENAAIAAAAAEEAQEEITEMQTATQSAISAMQTATQGAISDMQTATNAAVTAATQATQGANSAATAATGAKNNADQAAQSANEAAAAASGATSRANAAAQACEGIAAGINTMTDEVTGYVYSIGVSGGMIYLERVVNS